MSDLPYCGICEKQIVNAPSIGWYCPTIGCEGDWPQKANIVFDYKTDVQIIKEKDEQISLLKRDYEVMYKLQQGGEKQIAELKKKRGNGEINAAYAATIERQDIERQKQNIKINKLKQKLESRKYQTITQLEKERDYFESSHLMTLKEINGLHEEIAKLEKVVEAAKALQNLKHHKVLNGKDNYYLKNKEKAWDNLELELHHNAKCEASCGYCYHEARLGEES